MKNTRLILNSLTSQAAGRATAAALVLVLLSCVLLTPHTARANPPGLMAYQGYVVDGSGAALAATTPRNFDVVFRIYPLQQGGTSVWAEAQTVTVDKGYFSVLLGQGAKVGAEPGPGPNSAISSVFAHGPTDLRFIGITVKITGQTDVEIAPRLQLITSPYAFTASNATGLISPNGSNLVATANGQLIVNGTLSTSGGVTGLTTNQIPNLDASKITTGSLLDARLSSNVALRGSANTFNGNQRVVGLVRMGSDTTSQAPNLPGLVVRRINSSSSATNQVVAKCVEGYYGAIVTLERDGTAGGWVIRGSGTIGNFVVAGTGITTAGATVNVYKTYGGSIGTSQIFTHAQDIGHFRLSFGDPWQTSHMTEVVLTHWPGGVVWIGTVTSTVDQ